MMYCVCVDGIAHACMHPLFCMGAQGRRTRLPEPAPSLAGGGWARARAAASGAARARGGGRRRLRGGRGAGRHLLLVERCAGACGCRATACNLDRQMPRTRRTVVCLRPRPKVSCKLATGTLGPRSSSSGRGDEIRSDGDRAFALRCALCPTRGAARRATCMRCTRSQKAKLKLYALYTDCFVW